MTLLNRVSNTPFDTSHILRFYQEKEVDYLLSLVGKGEEQGLPNNASRFLSWLRSTDGTGKNPDSDGSWCAATRSHAGFVTALNMRAQMLYEPHRGARKLTRNIAAAGHWIIKPRSDTTRLVAIPKGAALCKKTGPIWKGHFMTVVWHDQKSDAVQIVEGNRNNRGSRGERYAVIDVRTLSPSDWRRDLYGVSALWIPRQPGE